MKNDLEEHKKSLPGGITNEIIARAEEDHRKVLDTVLFVEASFDIVSSGEAS